MRECWPTCLVHPPASPPPRSRPVACPLSEEKGSLMCLLPSLTIFLGGSRAWFTTSAHPHPPDNVPATPPRALGSLARCHARKPAKNTWVSACPCKFVDGWVASVDESLTPRASFVFAKGMVVGLRLTPSGCLAARFHDCMCVCVVCACACACACVCVCVCVCARMPCVYVAGLAHLGR